ncbi:biotin-dependent carboxyltransferase family protein [Hyphomonas sp.]|uniref:5-oxoprolinase subunit C family protein n=1 Tax=Hyphomonas sp. TaxID=87 RepID=UPI0039197D67
MPYAGAADPVSLAIANRLAGQEAEATAFEISYGPATLRFDAAMQAGVAGADAELRLDGILQPYGQTLSIDAGATLEVSALRAGSRLYLAVSGKLPAQVAFGSPSTYLPAGLGGHEGRALQTGDVIGVKDIASVPILRMPVDLRFAASRSYALRAVAGPDWQDGQQAQLGTYTVTQRISRMGAEIEGVLPVLSGQSVRPSSAVMPGALQVTPSGRGFLLLADGQTTGGYPHLLQVIRADRHLLGQLRPSDRLQFLLRSQTEAEAALKAKQKLLETWLPGFRL